MVEIADSLAVNLNSKNVLIVDALNLSFRWKPHKTKGKQQDFVPFAADFVKTVKSLAKSYKAGKIIITADWGGSLYRREIFPEYKGNRKELYENDTPEEKEITRLFFDEYERTILACLDEFEVFRFKGVEADDIAAYIVKNKEDFGFEEIWLISSDRDWDLLISESVNRFSTVTRKEQTLDTWDNPVPPAMYLTYKCLTGDKGDNIPGVDGVGPKRAEAIINEYGDIFDICDAIPLSGKYKYIQALNDSKDQLLTNVELMDLITYSEEAIGKENATEIHMRLSR
jgi:DNA polymerase-1